MMLTVDITIAPTTTSDRPTPSSLAAVVAAGLEPTPYDLEQAREMTSHCVNRAAVDETASIILHSHAELIARWITNGDAVGVAQLVRSMRAAVRAGAERWAELRPEVAR
jgi:hypothetical protein